MKALTGNNLDTIEKHGMRMLTEMEVEEVSGGGWICRILDAFVELVDAITGKPKKVPAESPPPKRDGSISNQWQGLAYL